MSFEFKKTCPKIVKSFRSTQNDDDDDDDICPVCESECTCGNTNTSQSNPQPAAPLPPPALASTSVPLKIKLPARTYWNIAEKIATLDRWATNPNKPKKMTADSAIVDGSTNNYVMVHRSGPSSVPCHQLGIPGPSTTTSTSFEDSTSTMTESFDSDSSIRAEEENLIFAERREKVRRELLNNEESWHMEKRKWDHLKNNNNWEIRPRKRSVGPEDTDGDTESESDSQTEAEEEEEEGDDDEEADIQRYGHGMVTGWQSDDDDFDAELFFATLTDSSGPGSDADAEDEECSGDEHSDNSDLSSISMREATAAGLLSSTFDAGCPLVVTEDWDGRLVFANGLKDGQGVLDVHFEVDAAQRHRRIRETTEVGVEDSEDTVERDEDEDDADLISDDDGETTDDMLDHRSGISTPQGVPHPVRYPTPPVTFINPLSTFSPRIGSRRRSRTIKGTTDSPKPADILAGASKRAWDGSNKDSNSVRSPTVSIAPASPPDTSSTLSRQMPSMGSFKQVPADPKRRAIIDGRGTVVFSPFARARRGQRSSARGRKRPAAGLDVFPYVSKRPRQSSLPGSSRIALLVDGEGDPLVQSSPELLVPTASIGLDDVLDASFLDSDDSVEPTVNTSGERHFRNLSRWDRVPMSTFRRSRTAHMGDINVRRLGPPNDGVSYGSAGGHVLRKSPLGATLWQTSDRKVQSNPGSVTVSPVIFPVRDGYPTSTFDQYLDPLEEPRPTNPRLNKSHKQKRKEKKGRTRSIRDSSTSISTSNGFHQSLPIVPSLHL